MPKTDGYKTREKILAVAEKLFAEKGFNGTSIDKIAKAANVNKGLIYYHFKDKKDIIDSIFKSIISEIDQLTHLSLVDAEDLNKEGQVKKKIRAEVEYCRERKQIITVMLMEALKADGNSDSLFKCSELVFQQELNDAKNKTDLVDTADAEDRLRYLTHEFFTGFIPIVAFVALQEKWCRYFDCDKDKALEYFLESFQLTHLKSHLE